MLISIRHTIRLSIGEGAARAIQRLLLTPRTSSVQTVEDWRIEAPGMDGDAGFVDAYGNRVHLSSQTRPDPEVVIEVGGTVRTHDQHGVVGRLEGDPVPALFRRVTPLTRPIGAITSRVRNMPKDGRDRLGFLHALMERVGEVLGEGKQSQSQSQDNESLEQEQSQEPHARRERASASAHAHAFIGAARALDVPARYVAGYHVPDDEDAAVAFHAWAEAWDDGLGWIGFDAMLGYCPTERHVRVAVGLDADSAAPVRSVPSVGAAELGVVWIEAVQ